MISLPDWFARPPKKGAKATPPASAELTEQLHHAAADVTAAQARERAAAQRESAERSPEAVEAFEAAQAETKRIERFRDRLRQDLEQAEQREAAAERARKQARVEELRVLVSEGDGRLTDELVAREVELLRQLVDVRHERIDLSRRLELYATEARALGCYGLSAPRAAAGFLVAEALERQIPSLPDGDERRRMIHRVIAEFARWQRQPF